MGIGVGDGHVKGCVILRRAIASAIVARSETDGKDTSDTELLA